MLNSQGLVLGAIMDGQIYNRINTGKSTDHRSNLFNWYLNCPSDAVDLILAGKLFQRCKVIGWNE